jgi:ADP-ribosylation factor-like protein 2-binding protein
LFLAGDENKLIYTEIFQRYTSLVEQFLDERLRAAVPGFTMDAFMDMLGERDEGELDGEVFDLLLSLSDFSAFKDLMLAYRAEGEEGGAACGLQGAVISVQPLAVHREEQQEGEERADLDFGLVVTAVRK